MKCRTHIYIVQGMGIYVLINDFLFLLTQYYILRGMVLLKDMCASVSLVGQGLIVMLTLMTVKYNLV